MQLYALDPQKQLISAAQASRHRNYACLECQGVVRLRGGIHRQNHFFHLELGLTCHLSGKSMAHLQVQCLLQRLIPPGESRLEYRFPKINRIADVVWFQGKLIFEIQCSPISAMEVAKRNQDYHSMGYQVIWVLHDQQFNQWKISAAELHLRHQPLYYTNIDGDGNGFIYDQFDVIAQGLRRNRGKCVPVNLHRPSMLNRIKMASLIEMIDMPLFIRNRIKTVPIYFEGDLTHRYLSNNIDLQETFDEIREIEKANLPPVQPKESWIEKIISFGKQYVVQPYLYLLQHLLERACQ